jgi:hypothetical protein
VGRIQGLHFIWKMGFVVFIMLNAMLQSVLGRNFDLFDWKGLTEDLMDQIDDISKTIEQ